MGTMTGNFHQSFDHGDVKPPRERSTGLVLAGAAAVVAIWWRHLPITPWVALGIASVLASLSFAMPRLLKPLNLVWFRIGLLLHRVMNPLVMLAMFIFVFIPAGLIMRIWYDPLRTRRNEPGSTYWIDRTSSPRERGSMLNQF